MVVLVTAVLLLLTGIAVQSTMWHLMPLWYHATFLVLIVPVCLLAGRLRRQSGGEGVVTRRVARMVSQSAFDATWMCICTVVRSGTSISPAGTQTRFPS